MILQTIHAPNDFGTPTDSLRQHLKPSKPASIINNDVGVSDVCGSPAPWPAPAPVVPVPAVVPFKPVPEANVPEPFEVVTP